MSKTLPRYKEPLPSKILNPEADNHLNQSSQVAKEQKLNAEILRVRSQQILKQISHVWQMNEQQMLQFFSKFKGLDQESTAQSLLQLEGIKLVRAENKIFIGQISNKKKHGRGITIYQEGKIYEGTYDLNQKSGNGVQIYSNGNIYVGQYQRNKKHGKGTFFWFSLSSNSGSKDANQTVEQYEGQWWGGLPDGQGQHQKSNGDFYLGQFKNGLKHGNGIEYYSNGDKYNGQFINGLPEGYGQYSWRDGCSYKGDFKQGYRNGYGVWNGIPPNQENYRGHYMLDKKNGYGIYDWANGYCYKGNFVEDQRCGEGQLFFHEKLIQSGLWFNGERTDDQEFKQLTIKSVRTKKLQKTKSKDSKTRKIIASPSKMIRNKPNNQSFEINFKHLQSKGCGRHCCACKVMVNRSKSKQRLSSRETR